MRIKNMESFAQMPLPSNATVSDWVRDFVHSQSPRFKDKDKKTRIKMALGAYYAKQSKKRHDFYMSQKRPKKKKSSGKKGRRPVKRSRKAVMEDVAVNNIGGGHIEGAGVGPKGEPGVRSGKKRKLIMAFLTRMRSK